MKDITNKSSKDLIKMLNEKRTALQGFRFGTKSKNVKEGRAIKKDIARIMTALSAQAREASQA